MFSPTFVLQVLLCHSPQLHNECWEIRQITCDTVGCPRVYRLLVNLLPSVRLHWLISCDGHAGIIFSLWHSLANTHTHTHRCKQHFSPLSLLSLCSWVQSPLGFEIWHNHHLLSSFPLSLFLPCCLLPPLLRSLTFSSSGEQKICFLGDFVALKDNEVIQPWRGSHVFVHEKWIAILICCGIKKVEVRKQKVALQLISAMHCDWFIAVRSYLLIQFKILYSSLKGKFES